MWSGIKNPTALRSVESRTGKAQGDGRNIFMDKSRKQFSYFIAAIFLNQLDCFSWINIGLSDLNELM